jgi:hypothetical protein
VSGKGELYQELTDDVDSNGVVRNYLHNFSGKIKLYSPNRYVMYILEFSGGRLLMASIISAEDFKLNNN